jgi:hypothetical protein
MRKYKPKEPPKARNDLARLLWEPLFHQQVVPDKKKEESKAAARNYKLESTEYED